MHYFTEQAEDHRQALEKVLAKYGHGARIVSHRTIRRGGLFGLFSREGVEVTGYVRQESPSREDAGGAAGRGDIPAGTPSDRAGTGFPEPPDRPADRTRMEDTPPGSAFRTGEASGEAIRSGVSSASAPGASENTMRTVLSEIRRLRERMDAIPDTRERAAPEHPAVASVRAFLEANEFSEPYIDRIVARIGTELPLERLSDTEALERTVVEWIRDSILVRTVGETSCRRILVVVGPTGVGKTTTIAKLAAIHSVGIGGEERVPVHMITIDNYRIGARQQIETYGDIIGVPVTGVESVEDLQRTLALCPDSGMILVDTIGKSPSDRERIGEMNRLLAACGPDAEVHIAVSASMKTSDMERTLDAFAVFGYRAAILTKTDETACLGSALSALAAKKTPLSYITTGQRVPQDIEKARADRIVRRIVRPERGERPGRTASISGGNAP